MVEGVFGEGVGDAEEGGESSEFVQGYAFTSTSSDTGGGAGAGAGFGFDGNVEM